MHEDLHKLGDGALGCFLVIFSSSVSIISDACFDGFAVLSAPKPAARSRNSQTSKALSSAHEEFAREMLHDEKESKNQVASASVEEDEMDLDLDMFKPRAEPSQQQQVVSQQLQLQAAQKAEAERRKLEEQLKHQLRESGRKKVGEQLAQEKAQLDVLEQKTAQPGEEIQAPPRRKKWNRPSNMKLDLNSPELSSPEDGPLLSSVSKLRSEGTASPSSSASEFFSLSEDERDEDATPVPIRKHAATPRNSREVDPDEAFQAMCVALAEQKRLTARLSAMPVKEEEEDEDNDTNSDTAFWRRSDRGWASERQYPSRPTSLARRNSSFEESKSPGKQGDPLHFPSLSKSLQSDYRHL